MITENCKTQSTSKLSHTTIAQIFTATLNEITGSLPSAWETVDWSDGPISWRLFRLSGVALPHQGWKVHVSAAAIEASAVCLTVSSVLFRLSAAFKIARRLEDFIYINSGDAGEMQVGKVITIYPQSDDHTAEIARELDKAWPVGRGPTVQTDLHLRPNSAVSLRYGVFGSGPSIISSSGIPEFALVMPDGSLVPDTRRLGGEQSPCAPAPPVGCYRPPADPVRLGEVFVVERKQYVPLALLKQSPRIKIFLAFSVTSLSTVVVKLGYPGVAGDHRGVDAVERLKKEFHILSNLSDYADLAPKPMAWVDDEWPILVMEDFRGDIVSEMRFIERIECLLPLAKALARLHMAGFVHGDLKLENAVRRGESVGLIDFELTEREGDIAGTGGTRGHLGPEVKADAVAAFSRDIFALGSCVAQAILGIPLALLPNGTGRLRGLLCLEGARSASRLIARMSTSDPAARPSLREATAAIAGHLDELRNVKPLFGRPSTIEELNWCQRACVEAASLAHEYEHKDVDGICWRNEHFMRSFYCEGINIGAAGIILGLVTIDQALGRSGFSDQIDLGARWLSSRSPELSSAGLFTGNAGVAIALSVAGRRLGEEQYLIAGSKRLQNAAAGQKEIDLFSGSAGVLFASCILSNILGKEWPLELGYVARQRLHRHLCRTGGIPVWSLNVACDPQYLGCAHGSAGIAMALACWGRQTGDRRSVEEAIDVFQQIFAKGRTADGSALRMTLDSEKAHAVANWCHGVAGYLWCIVQAFGDSPALRDEIDWAVGVIRNSMTVGTPTYCHGLAGRLELWNMLAGIPRHRELAIAQAGKTVRALRLVHHRVHGKASWCSDDPEVSTPDLWVGFLGPASALALHVAQMRDPLLSGRWLSVCATTPKARIKKPRKS